MKTLTGMGGLGNAQELAELLRQMGRGPDSMLAHITPEEAQMLLESGGSGRMNPMTGLPEFQANPIELRLRTTFTTNLNNLLIHLRLKTISTESTATSGITMM
jgi:hypothetical protein